jgi:hypothetical protein
MKIEGGLSGAKLFVGPTRPPLPAETGSRRMALRGLSEQTSSPTQHLIVPSQSIPGKAFHRLFRKQSHDCCSKCVVIVCCTVSLAYDGAHYSRVVRTHLLEVKVLPVKIAQIRGRPVRSMLLRIHTSLLRSFTQEKASIVIRREVATVALG